MGKRIGLFVSLAVLVLVLATLVGCGDKTEETSGTQTTTTTTTTDNAQTNKDEGKTYGINEKATLKTDDVTGELTVTGVKTTNDLASPEANALLLTGPNDMPGANQSKAPASGKEFLMVTFQLKNTGTKQMGGDYAGYLTPSMLTLANAKGTSYDEVSTQGQGGVYNSIGTKPGEQSSVTAVYEVPTGETGLVMTVQPFGGDPIKFKIR